MIAKHYIIANRIIGDTDLSSGTDTEFLNDFEVSDLTFDCNQQNPPYTWKQTMIAACAIDLCGDNIAARRVRIINFGSRSPVKRGRSGGNILAYLPA